jgi:LDH2 family malate/lactate/ureidoglycolate dehydrogenase
MPEGMPGEGIGHFFGAMRINAFRPAEEFKKHMDNWITRFRDAKPANENQQIIIPGDPEREAETERLQHGIPLHAAVVIDLKAIAAKYGIPFFF